MVVVHLFLVLALKWCERLCISVVVILPKREAKASMPYDLPSQATPSLSVPKFISKCTMEASP